MKSNPKRVRDQLSGAGDQSFGQTHHPYANPQIVPLANSQELRDRGSGAGDRVFGQSHCPCSNPQIVPAAHSQELRDRGSGAGDRVFVQTLHPYANPHIIPVAKSPEPVLRDLRVLRGSSLRGSSQLRLTYGYNGSKKRLIKARIRQVNIARSLW